MKTTTTLFVLLFVSIFGFGQNPYAGSKTKKPSIPGTIKGDLIDENSNQPIEFASVSIKNREKGNIVDGAISDIDGKFKISEVPTGNYDLVINFLGYQEKVIESIDLTLKTPDYDAGRISLLPDNVILNEVEVVGQRATVENHIDKLVYNAENDPSTQGGDASDVLRKVPMLSVDLEGNVSLRGSQGVRILMNGKPSGMLNGNVADALKMIPADQIVKVEVITSPSAKYDAEGTAGIINIITKKKNIDGFAGNVSTSVGSRINRGGLGINYAKGRFGFNANGGGFYRWPNDAESSSIIRNFNNGELAFSRESNGLGTSSYLGYNGQFGAYYDFNAFNALNFNFNTRGSVRDNERDLNTITWNGETQTYDQSTDVVDDRGGYEMSMDYTRKFANEGEELSLGAQFDKQTRNNDNDILWTGDIDRNQLNNNKSNNKEWTLQLDYVKPVTTQFELELGAKGILSQLISDYEQSELNDAGSFELVPAGTNEFQYDQDVLSGYASGKYTFNDKWSMITGLRYEHTALSFDNPQSNESVEVDRDYDNYIPNVTLARKINNSTIKASYNQRLRRPRLRELNPYRDFSDENVYSVGNPDLDPELSHQYELGYSTFIKGTVINFSTYFRHTTDIISRYQTVSDEGASVTTYANLGKSDNLGINLFTSTRLGNNITIRFNGDAANTNFVGGEQVIGEQIENNVWTFRLFGNGSLSLNKGWKIDVFGFYNSPRYTLQGRNPSFSMLSMGANKDIWNKKGSIGISIFQPFSESMRFITELESTDVYNYSSFEIPFRSIGINFRYRFGKLDFDQKKARRGTKNNDSGMGGDGGGF